MDSKDQNQRDFYDELKINKFNLEQEWLQQPERAMYWAERAATARREMKDAEMERKITKATLYKKHRSILESKGVKVTDVMIDSYVKTDPEYRLKTDILIAAQENFDIMDAAKWEFLSRKTSLEKIQEGILSGLFSEPRSETRDTENIRERIKSRLGENRK